MKQEFELLGQASAHERRRGRAFWLYAAVLAVLLGWAFHRVHSIHNGDMLEYGLMTIALAEHGTPDIRVSDLDAARPVMPGFVPNFDDMAVRMKAGDYLAVPGILHYRGSYYAIHFFGYPLLAAGPYRLLQAAGADPLRSYMIVNTVFVFILGLAMYRLFGSPWRAALGLLAWVLCGGMLYWQWSSPECMSACALLAGLILFSTGAPLLGGLLAGLGAMQNPPIVFFCAFAPLLRIALGWRKGLGLAANLRGALRKRDLGGIVICAAVFGLPILYNLYVFNMPSAIGSMTTEIAFVTPKRLHSFLFDLNQGVAMGVPAVLAALLFWRGRRALALAACGFTVAMAIPSLSTQNFNSGSAGIMRYAFWASMPLLYVFLWRLRLAPRWPLAALALVLGGQALAMAHARSFNERGFSPVAARVMAVAPAWYNPDPEIFGERSAGYEAVLDPARTFAWRANGAAVKTMYHVSNAAAGEQLCGAGRALAPDNDYTEAERGWRYINGPVRCSGEARS